MDKQKHAYLRELRQEEVVQIGMLLNQENIALKQIRCESSMETDELREYHMPDCAFIFGVQGKGYLEIGGVSGNRSIPVK